MQLAAIHIESRFSAPAYHTAPLQLVWPALLGAGLCCAMTFCTPGTFVGCEHAKGDKIGFMPSDEIKWLVQEIALCRTQETSGEGGCRCSLKR